MQALDSARSQASSSSSVAQSLTRKLETVKDDDKHTLQVLQDRVQELQGQLVAMAKDKDQAEADCHTLRIAMDQTQAQCDARLIQSVLLYSVKKTKNQKNTALCLF